MFEFENRVMNLFKIKTETQLQFINFSTVSKRYFIVSNDILLHEVTL